MSDSRTPQPTDSTTVVPLVADLPLERWEGCTLDELRTAWSLPHLHLFSTVSSTNDVARTLAARGAPAGTVVLAEEQRAGRGRAGRSWSSAPGLGLWLSLIARPDAKVDSATLPLRVALAVATAFERWIEKPAVRIKWPNDILLNSRKVGGILCEGAWDGRHLGHVVVGIGLNLLHGPADFSDEIRSTAISLRTATGRPVSRFDVAGAVLAEVGRALAPAPLGAALHDELNARDALAGRQIEVLEPETGRLLLSGHAAGIAPSGALLVYTGTGLREVLSGTVRLTESPR